MLPKKSAINYIEQKILLPNLDSWFSNFLIEEFRTDIVAKMSDCVNSTRDNSSWKFRLVCWSTR